jgi:hypothetical protein
MRSPWGLVSVPDPQSSASSSVQNSPISEALTRLWTTKLSKCYRWNHQRAPERTASGPSAHRSLMFLVQAFWSLAANASIYLTLSLPIGLTRVQTRNGCPSPCAGTLSRSPPGCRLSSQPLRSHCTGIPIKTMGCVVRNQRCQAGSSSLR